MQDHPHIVTFVGALAEERLRGSRAATLNGITRRGFYLRLDSQWIVFVSLDAFRGPLTINVRGQAQSWSSLSAGSPVEIHPARIVLPSIDLVIDYGGAPVWQAPPASGEILPAAQRRASLTRAAQALLTVKSDSPLGNLLPELLGWQTTAWDSTNPYRRHLEHLRDALQNQRVPQLVQACEPLLGLGRGLTPSGDDLILGMLLALSRWGDRLAPGWKPAAICQRILPLAYRKTTTLAANLIECAGRGQADERLLLALDGILTGAATATECAAYLAGWGSSSGLDALVGMTLVI